ncbi:MAG: DUF4190 domain-containing protein [Ruminococcus sp.]
MDNYNNGYNNNYPQGDGQNPQPNQNNYSAQDYQQPYGSQNYSAQDYQQPYGGNDYNQNNYNQNNYNQNNYQSDYQTYTDYNQPYQAPQYTNSYPVEDSSANGMAIASLVLGIVSFFCCGVPCSVVGLILGIISKKRKPLNNGKATAGIVLSIIALVLWAILFILNMVAGSTFMSTSYYY